MAINPFQIERFFAKWEFSAPYLLAASDCESMSIGELLDLTGTPASSLLDLRLGYTESQGDPAFRETIAAFQGNASADEVIVFNAPEEAIFVTMMTLLEPGDRVVVQTPCYQSLSEVAAYRGATVEPWPLTETGTGWHIDLERLADLLTPQTKLLVINAPHNPTGYLPSAAEFEAIITLARAHGLWLFCDEMYRGLEYEAGRRLPSAATRYERAVSLSGMSKTYGLPGLRIGWLAVPDQALRQALLEFKDYTTICNSAPGELLADIALQHADTLIERNLGIVRHNLALIDEFLIACPDVFAWRSPKAGPIAFPRLRRNEAEAFCDQTVRDCGVLLVPSTVFQFGDQHVRLGLGRKSFGEGLAVFEDYLS